MDYDYADDPCNFYARPAWDTRPQWETATDEFGRDVSAISLLSESDAFKFAVTFIERSSVEESVKAEERERAIRKILHGKNRYEVGDTAGKILRSVQADEAERRRIEAEIMCCTEVSSNENWAREQMVNGMFKYDRLAEAQTNLGADMWRLAGDWRIYAIDVERRSSNRNGVKKKYIVASVARAYIYAVDRVKRGVMMHEVINSDLPCHFHLDIEMAAIADEFIVQCGSPEVKACYEAAVEASLVILGVQEQLGMDDEAVKEMAIRVVSAYRAVCSEELTEEECKTGAGIMTDFVRSHLEDQIVEIKERGAMLRTVTACRPKKFSIHIVEEELFFDSNVASLPIFVFVMCRVFTVVNLLNVVVALLDIGVGHEVGGEFQFGGELRFRLRALCLEKAVVVSDFIRTGMVDYVDGVAVPRVRPEGDKNFVFSGYCDTPIDEVVYTKNHCLRVPGSVKMGRDGEAPMLAPLLEGGSTHRCAGIFPTCRHFSHVFGSGGGGGRLSRVGGKFGMSGTAEGDVRR